MSTLSYFSASAVAYINYGYVTINGVVVRMSAGYGVNNGDLHDANLEGANLYGSYLRGTDLTRANLSHALLQGIDFGKSDVGNFLGANLTYTNFTGSDLQIADFVDVILSHTNMSGADLSGVSFGVSTFYKVNFTGANLTWASLPFIDWADFVASNNIGLSTYLYDPTKIFFTGRNSSVVYDNALPLVLQTTVPEPSTYGFMGIGAFAVAFAARRRKLKTA